MFHLLRTYGHRISPLLANLLGTFGEASGNRASLSNAYTRCRPLLHIYAFLCLCFREPSGNLPGTFREPSRNLPGPELPDHNQKSLSCPHKEKRNRFFETRHIFIYIYIYIYIYICARADPSSTAYTN